METKADYNVKLVNAGIRSVMMYHCAFCMKRKSHFCVDTGKYEYLICRECGRVTTFELANDAPNNNHNV